MTPSARLASAIELIDAMEATPRRPADAVANSFFRERRFIGGGDRRAISAIVWDVLRHWRRLGWWLSQAGGVPGARLLVAAEQIRKGGTVGEIGQAYVEGRFASGALTKDERYVLDRLGAFDEKEMPRAVRLEVPDWLLPLLEARFGETLEEELAAMGTEAPLDRRGNIRRCTGAGAGSQLAG